MLQGAHQQPETQGGAGSTSHVQGMSASAHSSMGTVTVKHEPTATRCADRPPAMPQTQVPQIQPNQSDQDPRQLTINDPAYVEDERPWTCRFCTIVNDNGIGLVCAVCQNPRHAKIDRNTTTNVTLSGEKRQNSSDQQQQQQQTLQVAWTLQRKQMEANAHMFSAAGCGASGGCGAFESPGIFGLGAVQSATQTSAIDREAHSTTTNIGMQTPQTISQVSPKL